MIYYDFVLSGLYTCSTVKPPLTSHLSTMATNFCPTRKSKDWLLLKPLYNGNGH